MQYLEVIQILKYSSSFFFFATVFKMVVLKLWLFIKLNIFELLLILLTIVTNIYSITCN